MTQPTLSEQPIPAEFMERAAALRCAVVWQSNASNEVIARALMAEHDAKDARIAELTRERDEARAVAEEMRVLKNAQKNKRHAATRAATANHVGLDYWKNQASRFEARLAEQTKLLDEAAQIVGTVAAWKVNEIGVTLGGSWRIAIDPSCPQPMLADFGRAKAFLARFTSTSSPGDRDV